MKIVLFTFASILLVHCFSLSSALLSCYKCEKDGKCEDQGTKEECNKDGTNCYYTMTGDSNKIKGCKAEKKKETEAPQLNGLKDLNPTPTMKWDGCFDITKQVDNKQAYKTCFCSSENCNINDVIKPDMVISTGEKGERKCYTCGDLSSKKPYCETGNCFIVESKRTKSDDPVTEVYKEKFEGHYYVCNKNKCNYDKKSWEDSSVAGLTSSFTWGFESYSNTNKSSL
ncbi:unnamed protein product [Lepeophtheirus salmonis]|uniref:(salmon louse) hypothetical protein n=1 Tax=Lepeophtheirus salmonis TaxID=72036 RepID=A0A7R8H2N8_LEPSM|nr:unnamed protein product [Lepeophtheirus salmonis]CAF2827389.1 unnamed protein product [Lepeophtheirus salmonis]